MRIRNTTNKPTKELSASGLANMTFVVYGQLLKPGETTPLLKGDPRIDEVLHLLAAGALVYEEEKEATPTKAWAPILDTAASTIPAKPPKKPKDE